MRQSGIQERRRTAANLQACVRAMHASGSEPATPLRLSLDAGELCGDTVLHVLDLSTVNG